MIASYVLKERRAVGLTHPKAIELLEVPKSLMDHNVRMK